MKHMEMVGSEHDQTKRPHQSSAAGFVQRAVHAGRCGNTKSESLRKHTAKPKTPNSKLK